MEKKQFVEGTMSDTVSEAVAWVNHLEYNEQMEEVAIVCNNGHKYYVNVACDSKGAIIEDVMKEVMRH